MGLFKKSTNKDRRRSASNNQTIAEFTERLNRERQNQQRIYDKKYAELVRFKEEGERDLQEIQSLIDDLSAM